MVSRICKGQLFSLCASASQTAGYMDARKVSTDKLVSPGTKPHPQIPRSPNSPKARNAPQHPPSMHNRTPPAKAKMFHPRHKPYSREYINPPTGYRQSKGNIQSFGVIFVKDLTNLLKIQRKNTGIPVQLWWICMPQRKFLDNKSQTAKQFTVPQTSSEAFFYVVTTT